MILYCFRGGGSVVGMLVKTTGLTFLQHLAGLPIVSMVTIVTMVTLLTLLTLQVCQTLVVYVRAGIVDRM